MKWKLFLFAGFRYGNEPDGGECGGLRVAGTTQWLC